MKKIGMTLLLLAAMTFTASAAAKEIKITKVSGQVRVLSGDKSALAVAGQVLPADATLKTYSGAQVVLTIGGNTKVIDENRTLSASALTAGDSGLEGALNLMGKLSSKNYTGYGAVSVAGVRGAEQGKKASFGVQWQGQAQAKPASSVTATSEIDQARSLCGAQDFEGAITKLTAFISATQDDQAKAKAQLLLAQANLELARSDKAQMAAEEGLRLAPKDATVSAQLKFTAVSALWLAGKVDATLAAIENHFPVSSTPSDEYWNAQVVKVLALRATGNKVAARKLKTELSTTCPSDELVAALAQITL